MMTLFNKITLVLIFNLSFSLFSLSQLHVVKDNIACLYGLKNDTGEWVVPAEYTHLDQSCNSGYCYYSIYKNSKYGALDKTGKLIIPPEYDVCYNVGTHAPGMFYVQLDGKLGVVNSHNEFVIPPKYTSLQHVENGVYLYSTKKQQSVLMLDWTPKKTKFGLLDTNGILITEKFYFPAVARFNKQNVVLLYEKKKGGYLVPFIINSKLDKLVPPVYDNLYAGEDIIRVVKNNLTGFIDRNLTVAVPVIYDEFKSQLGTYFWTNQTIIMRKGKRWGMMNTNGKIYIEPQYDSIAFIEKGEHTSFWIYKQGKYEGLMNDTGKLITEPVYEKIRSIYSVSDGWEGFTVFRDKKAGILNSDGSYLIPPEFHTTYLPSTKNDLFYNDHFVLIFEYPTSTEKRYDYSAPPKIDTCVKVMENELWKIYKSGDRHYPFQKKMVNNSTSIVYEPNAHVTHHGHVITLFYNNKNYTFDLKGNPIYKKLDNKTVYKVADNYYLYTAANGKYGTMNENAEVILDTTYYKMFRAYDDILWIKYKESGCRDDYYTKNNDACDWYLCDLTGKKILDTAFDFPGYYYGQYQPVRINHKTGILDFKKMELVVPAIYNSIGGINRYYQGNFYIASKDSSFQIYDREAKLLSDQNWTYIMPLNYPIQFSHYLPQNNKVISTPESIYLLSNDSDSMIISESGNICTDDKLIRKLIYVATFKEYEKRQFSGTVNGTRFTLYWELEDSTHLKNVFHVIDLLLKENKTRYLYRPQYIYYNYQGGNKCNYITSEHYEKGEYPDYFKDYYEISYVSSKAIAVWRSYRKEADDWYENSESINYYKSGNQFVRITPDSLFSKGTNTRAVMEELITEAVTLRDDIELDCSKPGSLYDQTNHEFSINNTGITVMIKGYTDPDIELFIPWIKLQKYAPEKGIVADFIEAGKK